MHAEIVIKELSSVEPVFLAVFGIDELLDVEACSNSILEVFKAYIEKKVATINAEVLVALLI